MTTQSAIANKSITQVGPNSLSNLVLRKFLFVWVKRIERENVSFLCSNKTFPK